MVELHRVISTATILIALSRLTTSQSTNTSKRGLPYYNPGHYGDFDIFFSRNSTVKWYANWSPYPSSSIPDDYDVEFLPMIHGTSNIKSDVSTVKSLRPRPRHLLTFNEPDGSLDSGGSAISPQDAAEAYISTILPLRSSPYNFLLSHPSVTGTGNGLEWLRQFNASCYRLNPVDGCPADFVAAHFYGGFPALASWLGQLHDFYGGDNGTAAAGGIYITEVALPQADVNTTFDMMRQSLPYLDQLDYVAGYAWFGLFRADEANAWTGPGVSMLNDAGGLTELGSLYLGGADRGYPVGATSDAPAAWARVTTARFLSMQWWITQWPWALVGMVMLQNVLLDTSLFL